MRSMKYWRGTQQAGFIVVFQRKALLKALSTGGSHAEFNDGSIEFPVERKSSPILYLTGISYRRIRLEDEPSYAMCFSSPIEADSLLKRNWLIRSFRDLAHVITVEPADST
jgi:hypothetical protein